MADDVNNEHQRAMDHQRKREAAWHTLPVQPAIDTKFHWAGDLWHVRGYIDDGIVCRRWRSAKQRWHYEWFSPVIISMWRGGEP